MTEHPHSVDAINIIFDGPPGDGPRFVEVEDDAGKSMRVGEWVDRGDGYWALRIPCHLRHTRLPRPGPDR